MKYSLNSGLILQAMNRRDSIKYLAASYGALTTLPAWADGWSDLATSTSHFNSVEQELIAHVADTIIPPGTAIGARSIGVDKFLLKLFDECYEPAIQQGIQKQLERVNSKAKADFGRDFGTCSQPDREQVLLSFANSSMKEDQDFFQLMKSETIRGFNTSKEVMLQYLKYKIAPDHYYGCVEAKA